MGATPFVVACNSNDDMHIPFFWLIIKNFKNGQPPLLQLEMVTLTKGRILCSSLIDYTKKQKQKEGWVPFVATHNNGSDDETITMLMINNKKTQKGSGPPFYHSSRWRSQKHGESLFLINLLKEKKAKKEEDINQIIDTYFNLCNNLFWKWQML